MWESWRTDLSFVLVGAIFLVCQSLSGGVTDPRAEGADAAPGDRSYRDAWRDETFRPRRHGLARRQLGPGRASAARAKIGKRISDADRRSQVYVGNVNLADAMILSKGVPAQQNK